MLCGVAAAARSPFGRVVLVAGPESLLADRAVEALVAAALTETPDAEVSDVEAGRLDYARLAELTGGSLFATRQVAVLRDLAQLPDDLHAAVLALATDPVSDAAVVLVHGGGNKGKGLLDKLKKLAKPGRGQQATVEVIDCPTTKPWELPKFVATETRRLGGRVDQEAAQFLVDVVGHDLRSLAGAVDQLLTDGDNPDGGGQITTALIKRYFAGRSEVTSFAVSDAALAGRTHVAMEQLRWALSTGTAPVLVTSALASGLRGLGRLVDAGSGLRDPDLAREIGVPPWKLKSMRAQARGWDQRGLATAIGLVAQADAEVKGAAADPAYALERVVLGVTRCRLSSR